MAAASYRSGSIVCNPARNEIANKFYTKRGFRALTNLFGKSP
jgi:hypothetical protein